MISYKVSDLKPDTFYKNDLILDKQFILNPSVCPLSENLINALKEWNFDTILADETTLKNPASGNEEKIIASEKSGIIPAESTSEKIAQVKAALGQVQEVKSFDDELKKLNVETEEHEEESEGKKELRRSISRSQIARGRIDIKDAAKAEKARMTMITEIYHAYASYIRWIFTRYATHKELNLEEISATIQELCMFIRDNRRYVLRVNPELNDKDCNYMITHAMRSTVLAITMGLQLRMPLAKLVELGVACSIHEIGQIRLPPQLYMNNRMLTTAEKKEINTHPIIGYNIVKEAGFPLSIQLGILEHHERETGTGYPRHLMGDKISPYAKIISVACSFEAMTSPRFYKEERTSYEGMVEMLKNTNHQYDDNVLKALLYSLSIFPIGAYVYLSDGRLGQVTDVNPGDPKNPIVQIIGESEKDGSPKNIQTDNSSAKIVRVMNRKEANDVIKALNANVQI